MSDKNIKYLKDYSPTDYLVDTIDLTFIINDNKTVEVISVSKYYKNPKTNTRSLVLNGEAKLVSVALDGKSLAIDDLKANHTLTLNDLPNEFTLSITTRLVPYENKTCMGLYASGNNLITQCEPEGFRMITYYQDRPDVLATFSTTIIYKDGAFNTVLSNGNRILTDTNHLEKYTQFNAKTHKVIKWQDPFKKPSYLFALIIGNLHLLEDTYKTRSGRNVALEIYTDNIANLKRSKHAMESLKTAMKWDEDRFNLEYDLDNYMIVSTHDFNMGAMENKGLNVFNAKYILADKDTATDNDFILIEAVIGHEYFHNWTGNRVTCRDWFQLSLKEGLTVFRDHEFTSDLNNRGVKRISDVKQLRQSQFPVDAGPLAHSVRPESYMEINNFYTTTIYEKGSEVVRMYQTILGTDGFQKGLALYINRHDGTAASCEDFCQAMMDANNIELSQFMLWYKQAGTPIVNVVGSYKNNEYTLSFEQTIPDTPGQTNKQAMLIPIKIGLLDSSGHELANVTPVGGKYVYHDDGLVLLLTDTNNTFVFKDIKSPPIPSLLRGFSAPINLNFKYTDNERLHLVNHDSDEFNRFEQLQILIRNNIIDLYNKISNKNTDTTIDSKFWISCKNLINNINLAPEFRAIVLQLPTFGELLPSIKDANPKILAKAINTFAVLIGDNLFDSWMEIYNINLSMDNEYNFRDSGRRSLKNTALFYIIKTLSVKLNNTNSLQLIETLVLGQYHNSHNMTDSFAVLAATRDLDSDIRNLVLNEFYNKWNSNELVIDKWFAIQAMSSLTNTDMLNKLMVDKAFIATNPNKIYALLRNFTQNGPKFNTEDGYSFIADKIIIIDKFNPHVASVIAQGYSSVVYLESDYRKYARTALNHILAQENLSDSVYEIVTKISVGLKA